MAPAMNINPHSLPRCLIEVRTDHGDHDGLIDQDALLRHDDPLLRHRLKKRQVPLKRQISHIDAEPELPQLA